MKRRLIVAAIAAFFIASTWGFTEETTSAETTTPVKPNPIAFLAIGDSFTSGEGETDDNYYIDGSNSPGELCHVSSRSYPFLIGAQQGIRGVHSVACSGAQIGDVIADASSYKGQSGRLATDSTDERTAKQQAAIANFIPGRVPQEVFVDEYQPSVITVGIGGNDAGLFGKLLACASLDECEWVSPVGRAETAKEVASLYPKLVATYSRLHQLSPGSFIYAVDYPNIVDVDGQCGVIGLFFDHSERQLLSEGINYLDAVINAAATTVGLPVLEVNHAFDGHALCDDGLAMNTLRFGDDSELIAGLDWTKVVANESFHPTPYGHELLAAAMTHNISDIATYFGGCGDVVCPKDTPVPAPDTWLAGTDEPVPLSKQVTVTTDEVSRGGVVSVTIPVGEFTPGSTVQVSIHSNDIQLTTTAAASGDRSIQVAIPEGLDIGYHTLHLSGTNLAGEAIDLYQTVLVDGNPPKTVATNTTNNEVVDADPIATISRDASGLIETSVSDSPASETPMPKTVLGEMTLTTEPKKMAAVRASEIIRKAHRAPWMILAIITGITSIGAVLLTIWLKKTKNFR